jgi:polyhydroxybutyrate depolymerase
MPLPSARSPLVRFAMKHQFVLLALPALLVGFVSLPQHAPGQEHSVSSGMEEAQSVSTDELLVQDGKKKKGKDSKKKGKDSKKKHPALKHLAVTVGGLQREALVAYPKSAAKASKAKKGKTKEKTAAPVVFVFHGHGHTMKSAAEGFACHEHWANAICVYMQGLRTPSPNDPQGKEFGWELAGDRDYLFFDAVLTRLNAEHAIDRQRIFATGFSNGAFFTFGLWARRGPLLRAVAPCAGFYDGAGLSPKPCLLIAGKKDKQFEKQKATIEMVRKVNGCEGKGVEWPRHKSKLHGTLYPSSKGAPTAKVIHDGGHSIPNAAGTLIVEFFKEVAKK